VCFLEECPVELVRAVRVLVVLVLAARVLEARVLAVRVLVVRVLAARVPVVRVMLTWRSILASALASTWEWAFRFRSVLPTVFPWSPWMWFPVRVCSRLGAGIRGSTSATATPTGSDCP
jgi:hypothetical protein